MTDLDRTSLDRILPDVAGAPDWADVLRRSGAGAGARRWRIVVFAAAALVVALGAASAIGGVRAFVLPDKASLVCLPWARRRARRRTESSSFIGRFGA